MTKSAREEIRITLDDFHGHSLINIRTWFDDGSGVAKPGKGLALRVGLFPDFAKTVQTALAAVQQHGGAGK
jgi:hypothetical protein